MAVVAPSSPGGMDPKPDRPMEDPPSLPSPQTTPTVESAENPNLTPITSTPNPNPLVPPRPPSVPSFTPSFRPIGAPSIPQFTHLANPNLSNPAYQVSPLQPPGVAPPGVYYPPGSYVAPNGYMTLPPPGVHRYPGPYHPGFPPPPGAPIGAIPPIHRPPIHGIRGVPSLVSSITRPPIPFVAPAEKPQTTVYVGKIASTVGNDFIESVLRLCGPVKSWKRAENPSDGTFRGFGFCEFESAEGVLRALRLLNKLNLDGQELVLNVNQATREYLERYVVKKKEREKLKESGEDAVQPGSEKQEVPKSVDEKLGAGDESDDKEKEDNARKFGIVSDEDRDADTDALDKLTNMIHERMQNQPPPPPPPSETAAEGSKSTDVDIIKTDSGGNKGEEMMGDSKDHDRHESSPSERTRRSERSVERDREKDLKRDKEREIERFERGRERDRLRRERERDMKIRESDRLYKELLKDWEAREREKETQRQREFEREKERARERRREVKEQEIESDEEDTRKRRHRSSMLEEKRRRRQREKEEDLADVMQEEEEIEEAKRRDEEEQKQKEESKLKNGENATVFLDDHMTVQDHQGVSGNEDNHNAGEESLGNGDSSEPKQESNAPSRKLGFGLIMSGKRTAVLPVFHEEDENVEEKKMRPLVPIDYSAEEMQEPPPVTSDAPVHLAAAAEFAKRISGASQNRKDTHKEKPHRGREEEESKKLLDAKQLIDMIPKTKDKLFSYQINWDIYDKHGLHERMKPWISKKITEFLGEEETTLVDYIVSSTREHVQASKMLEMLQSILDDEAEMFVLKMWRMLIFEIKKVETGLAQKIK